MIVESRYQGRSAVVSGLRETRALFATNQLRDPAFLRAEVTRPLPLREALGALHQVVISDYKYHPRDRVAFRAWLAAQDRQFLASLRIKSEAARQKIADLEAELSALDQRRADRLRPFYRARAQYFDWVFTHQYELNYLLDPVVTVHPDEVSFEAFSKDESSYARLGVRHDSFGKVDAFACGTTNIDYSAGLARAFDRMRSYRATRFEVDAAGLTVNTDAVEGHREKKIDLPDSWVKGFLQVQATMTLGLKRVRLEAVDLYNLCRFLKRHRAKVSPRAMRFELTPGRPTRVVFEPWDVAFTLSPGSAYDGPEAVTVRTWGRDRLLTLGRLIAQIEHVDLYLAGDGLPTVYVAQLGGMTFTLALSGWTDNDWTTSGTRFDLLSRRLPTDAESLTLVHQSLSETRRDTDAALALRTGLGVEKVRSTLSYLCQTGRVMFDLGTGVYRLRELFATPFTPREAVQTARGVGGALDPVEKAGQKIFASGGVLLTARRPVADGFKLSGSVKGTDGARVRPVLHIGIDGRVIDASCSCAAFTKHGLTKGPCEHMLALRLAHIARLEEEDTGG